MNEATNNSAQGGVMKVMAVIGFIAVIIFAVWLAVQIVKVIPGAFSSLASIADGVYNNQPETTLAVAASENILNTGESFTLSWTDMTVAGNYTFMYQCAEGVAVDVRDTAGNIIAVACDTPLNLGGDIASLSVAPTSEKRRFTDVRYTVTFTPENDTSNTMEKSGKFTVVNPSIPQSIAVRDEIEVAAPEVEPENGAVAGESTSEEVPSTPAVSTPTPTITETPIMAIPVSDPAGFADLEVRYIGVGTLSNNNQFNQMSQIDNDTRGSFRFEVRNVGTKTSSNWKFEATLTSGTVFESETQTALRPNERSIITLGFDAVGETGFQTFGAAVSGGGDTNPNNNQFTWAVEVVS